MKATSVPLLLVLSAALCIPVGSSVAADAHPDTQGSANRKTAGKASTTKATAKGKPATPKTKPAGKRKTAIAKSKNGKPAASLRARAAAKEDDIEFANFNQWRAVSEFIDDMSSAHGFDREQLRTQFGRAHYIDAVIKLINPPPAGKAKNWTAYHDRFVEPQRLQAGLTFWNRHEDALRRAEAEFGVPAEIIVGIIGVETFYGRDTGRFRVVDALTTLAFAYPDTPNRDARKTYFRNELRQALLYARENDLDPFTLNGSFAGAIGWPQFMPGSIRKFAVDFDGDGKIDLRNSPVDAIGSVASFLSHHGWQSGLPLVYPATVSAATDAGWPAMIGQGLEARYTLGQMKEAGVNIAVSVPDTIAYGLVDLQDGERPIRYWVGTANFYAVTQYNRSFFYAMAVIDLGQAVGQQRARQAASASANAEAITR
jgi:membrane-bound lytic murein transglycosylase B